MEPHLNASDLKRHYHLRKDLTVGEIADIYQLSISAVYGVVEGTVPWTLERIMLLLRVTEDPTLLEELASRQNCFVIPRRKRKLRERELADRTYRVSRQLGKKPRARDIRELGLDLLAYWECLTNGAIQKELNL